MTDTSIRESERGAVALITSIIVSILLTIIVTGLITLMASELRQANDAEQSTRAYYAAQSGIEDGVQKVIAALNLGTTVPATTCPASANTTIISGIPVGWTCQRITYSGSPVGILPVPDQAATVDTTGAPPFNKMVVYWDTASGVAYNMPNPLPVGAWSGAAALEMTVIDYKNGNYPNAQTAQSDIKTENILAIPHVGAATNPTLGSVLPNNPYQGSCAAAATTYHCTITVNGFSPARNYIIRLRSRYQGTAYKLDFYQGANYVQVPDGTATIDVTAKAGDVFRRVIYKVPITNGAASGLDYVLFSDNNICKDYSVLAGAVTAVTYPCPLN